MSVYKLIDSHMVTVSMGFSLFLGISHFSEARASCPEPYTQDRISADFTAVKNALKEELPENLTDGANSIEKNVLCIGEIYVDNPAVFNRVYRYIGYKYFYSNDKAEAEKWFRSAQESDPSFMFKERDPETEELKQYYRTVKMNNLNEKGKVDGKTLQKPEGTKLYINGLLVNDAVYGKNQHNYAYLVSEAGSSKVIQARYHFEENFPKELLKDATDIDVYDGSMIDVDRLRPPEKTPLMVAGGISTLIAAGLYGYTFKTNQDFEAATTPEDLRSIQSLNNNLVIASGVVGFLGFGLGYTGILIDSKGGIRF